MSLHLVKLCVGADSVEDLVAWTEARMRAGGADARPRHVTRMTPKRADALLDGGSLYWVIKGAIQARQRLVAIEPFTDGEGVSRCALVLDRDIVRTARWPLRAFQGWRYLEPGAAPPDLGGGADGDLPPELQRELADLGLL